MSELERVLTKTFAASETTAVDLRKLRERLVSETDRLVTTLQRPQYRELARFATAWTKLMRQMEALERAIDERLREIREKQADPLAELFEQLRVKPESIGA